jgi:hypothetical protein
MGQILPCPVIKIRQVSEGIMKNHLRLVFFSAKEILLNSVLYEEFSAILP